MKNISRKSFVAAGLFAALLLHAACNEEEYISPQEQLQRDIEIIDEYLADRNIDAEEHDSGLRYVTHDPGTGASPALTDSVTVNYEGRFLANGDTFDEADSVTFKLSALIAGWQIGIPLIKEGGSITLYVPSGYAYGRYGSRSIPGNSILIFDIDLIKVGGE